MSPSKVMLGSWVGQTGLWSVLMNSRIPAAVVGATLLLSGTAMAQQASIGPYVGGAVGQSTFWDVDNTEFDFLAFFISGVAGYRVSSNLRAEAELLYELADLDNFNVDIEVLRGTVSGYFDFAPIAMGNTALTPYAGGGLGFSNVEINNDENAFTWHAEGGVSIPIGNNLEIVPGIRFEYTFLDNDGAFNDPDDNLWVTQLRAGVRYSF